MLNSIEPPWYATRMPGGVTGKVREGLPMSIGDRREAEGAKRMSTSSLSDRLRQGFVWQASPKVLREVSSLRFQ